MAEIAVPKEFFREILRLIGRPVTKTGSSVRNEGGQMRVRRPTLAEVPTLLQDDA
jgi:hypothetical protein